MTRKPEVSKPSSTLATDSEHVRDLALLERVGTVHLRQRLGIEADAEARVFYRGRNFFHLENWYSFHSMLRITLRAALVHGRGVRNAMAIRVESHDIVIEGLPEAFDQFTILHISDLHLDMHPDIPHALIESVRDVDYDAVVLTGDYRGSTSGSIHPSMEAMSRVRIHLRDPVYAILGNHDSIRMVPPLEELGVRMLLNESVPIRRGNGEIFLAGIDDPHYYRVDNFEKACEDIPSDRVAILLAHSPEIYRHAAHAGFHVLLCGHTHGGQICLPGGYPLTYNARCPRRYCAGSWRYRSLRGYTSRGSGVSIVDVRFNCPPEITLHRLIRA